MRWDRADAISDASVAGVRANHVMAEPTSISFFEGCHKGFPLQNRYLLGLGNNVKLTSKKAGKNLPAERFEPIDAAAINKYNMENIIND